MTGDPDDSLCDRLRGALLAQARGLAGASAKIEELRPADMPRLHHLDSFDARRVDRECALHADAVRHAAHGERGAGSLAALPDHHALKDLDALLLALDDLDVHAYGVPGGEPPSVALEHPGLDDGASIRFHDRPPTRSEGGSRP